MYRLTSRALPFVSLLLFAAVRPDVVRADPPVHPPPCNVRLGALFCYSVTQTQGEVLNPKKFSVELEVLNWTSKDAYGVEFSIANAGTQVGGLPFISDAYVDSNGRPFGAPSIPPAGNLAITNNFVVTSRTPTQVKFGVPFPPTPGFQIAHRTFTGTRGGVPGFTFDGLLDPDFASPTTQAECIAALTNMIPTGTNFGGSPPLIGPASVLAIDDGSNVRDGFVIIIDDWDAGEEIALNWRLVDLASNDIGYHNGATGQVVGDEFGFGVINFVRLSSPAPSPLFNLNTGYDPPDSTNSNIDSPAFWAEDESGGVDSYPVNPIPAGLPGQGTYFAIELAARSTGPFRDPSNSAGQFGGVAITRGTNLVANRVPAAVPNRPVPRLSQTGAVILVGAFFAAVGWMIFRRGAA